MLIACIKWIQRIIAVAVCLTGVAIAAYVMIYIGYETGVRDYHDYLRYRKAAKGSAPLLINALPEGRPYLTETTGERL